MLVFATIGNVYCRKDAVSSHNHLWYIIETQQIIIIITIIIITLSFIWN